MTLKKDQNDEKLLQELAIVKQERTALIRDMRLFNFFFFNVFSEAEYLKRLRLTDHPNQLEKAIDHPSTLFVIKKSLALQTK